MTRPSSEHFTLLTLDDPGPAVPGRTGPVMPGHPALRHYALGKAIQSESGRPTLTRLVPTTTVCDS